MDCSFGSTSTSAQKNEEEARIIAVDSLYMLRKSGPITAGFIPTENDGTISLCVISGKGTLPNCLKIIDSINLPSHGIYSLATFKSAQINADFSRPNYICVKLYRNSEVVNGSDVMISNQDLNGSEHGRVLDPSWGRSHITLPGFELRKYCNTIAIYTLAAGALVFVNYSWLFISPQRICMYTMSGEEIPVLVTPYGPFVKYS